MNILTQEQLLAVKAIKDARPGDRLVLTGRAGCGKTTAIANAVQGRNALFLTPTHAARSVLERELIDTTHQSMTIHSAIGWRPSWDDDLNQVDQYIPAKTARKRQERLDEDRRGPFARADIIIVDEYSLVGSTLFRAVEDYANEFNLPVIYSGDHYQLPPVNDRCVIMDQGFKTITMTRSLRYSEDSEIFRYGETLRDYITHRPDDPLPCLTGGVGIEVVSGAAWMADVSRDYANGADIVAVAHDNNTLARLRKTVRQVDHNKLCVGDVVLSKQTDGVFLNGERLRISKIWRDQQVLDDVPRCISKTGKITLYGHSIEFEGTIRTAFVPTRGSAFNDAEQGARHYFHTGHVIREQATRVLEWLRTMNEFELAALSTAHKAQGRTVDTIYIDTKTVLKAPSRMDPSEHKRLLYTAITRARKRVVLYEMAGICEQGPLVPAAA